MALRSESYPNEPFVGLILCIAHFVCMNRSTISGAIHMEDINVISIIDNIWSIHAFYTVQIDLQSCGNRVYNTVNEQCGAAVYKLMTLYTDLWYKWCLSLKNSGIISWDSLIHS